ncbi:glycerophosphodiester phosphodiesterase family protein [Paenibacillus wulumuqiensis]|uniref:glycerophosphodiester phosphodiesterase family protein n=1 Tax=Paenibacillus wulumuqiensis TaxID=1567107 RepID=UPI0006964E37|nr:glycerophosphodiester phosphodiesterase family protein [Paenibacillus wulumuqiensis]
MRDDSVTIWREEYRPVIEEIISSFLDSRGRMMVAAHRGNWKQAPENSLAAIQYSIVAGADMIEIDVHRTYDGALVLMHDETVDRMTDGTGRIADMTLSELRSLRLRQYQGGACQPLTNYTIPTLEEALILIRSKAMINLDKCWEFREEVYAALLRTGTVDHALFKSNASPEEVRHFLQDKIKPPLYMHILDESNTPLIYDLDALFSQIRPQAVEICFEEEDSMLIHPSVLQKIRDQDCRLWVNTMWDSLCGGHTDGASLIDPEQGWQWHQQRGFNMIQTDYTEALIRYLNEQQGAYGWQM